MNEIEIRGVIVPDDEKWIYDWYGITATSPKAVRDVLKTANGEAVTIILNSGGGDVTSGQEIYTLLREYTGHVLIKIYSLAASAAAVVAASRESEISPAGQLMIHNVSTRAQGDYRDMEHAAEVLRNSNAALASAFVAKTGKTEAEILALMDNETWYTAQQAVDAGFVDRIMTGNSQEADKPLQLAASFGSGLLPVNTIEYAKAHFNKPDATAKAKAEYEFMNLEGKAK